MLKGKTIRAEKKIQKLEKSLKKIQALRKLPILEGLEAKLHTAKDNKDLWSNS